MWNFRKLCQRGASALFALGLTSTVVAAADLTAMIKARQKFFGKENVDAITGALPKDKVLFSWISNSSFATSMAGRVVFLDTYITRLETNADGRTPITIQDLLDLDAEAIFLGHGHFDHADNAAYIAAKTGATVYASEETCGDLQNDLKRMVADPVIQGNPVTAIAASASVQCRNVTSVGSVPGTQVVRLTALEPDVCITAFRHFHSVSVPPDPDFPPTPVRIIVDPRDAALFPAGTSLTPGATPLPGQMNIRTSGNNTPGGPIALFFSFVMRSGNNFTYVWHNSAGALKEGKGSNWDGTPADGARLVAVMKSLPLTDVHMGTASSGNFTNNGLRDLIMYQDALQPLLYIPNHLTSGTQTREASATSVYAGYLNQLALMKRTPPPMRWLIDPTDYLVPISFDLNDKAWLRPAKADRIKSFCG